MSKLIDFFSKKEITSVPLPYRDRIQKCMLTMMDTNKECPCEFCTAKTFLSKRLATITEWLITDHQLKTGLRLDLEDWLDVIIEAESHLTQLLLAKIKK
jgi:hypothetical protein